MTRSAVTNGPLPASDASAPGQRERVAWIDLFRGAAVLVMIETHVVNTFLATSLREQSSFAVLNYINGLVAPSFLFIAGFVQGMADGRAPGKPGNFARRSRRLLGIGAIGYALHFPWVELSRHRWEEAVRIGSQVDILQCLAASLGLLLLVTWLAQHIGGRRGGVVWWGGLVALTLATVFEAPSAAMWESDWVPVRAWINAGTGSWFPLFPWAGFVFVGALAGAALRVCANFAVRPFSLVLTLSLVAAALWTGRDAGYSPVGPASFVERTVWVLVLAAFSDWLAAHRRRLPTLVLFAGKHSLTLYVAHLVLISMLAGAGVPMNMFSVAGVLGLLVLVTAISVTATWAIGRWAPRQRRAGAMGRM